MLSFIWTKDNVEHIGKHGVTPAEAEHVVLRPLKPYPLPHGNGKWLARGQTPAGRYLQVIYVELADAYGIDWEDVDLVGLDEDADLLYVVHARPMTGDERKNLRKRRH